MAGISSSVKLDWLPGGWKTVYLWVQHRGGMLALAFNHLIMKHECCLETKKEEM